MGPAVCDRQNRPHVDNEFESYQLTIVCACVYVFVDTATIMDRFHFNMDIPAGGAYHTLLVFHSFRDDFYGTPPR